MWFSEKVYTGSSTVLLSSPEDSLFSKPLENWLKGLRKADRDAQNIEIGICRDLQALETWIFILTLVMITRKHRVILTIDETYDWVQSQENKAQK